MNVITFEGLVKVCNLAGVCVLVKAGQMTSVRSEDNSGPLPAAAGDAGSAGDFQQGYGSRSPVGSDRGRAHLGVWGTVGIVAGAVGVGLGVGLRVEGVQGDSAAKGLHGELRLIAA